MARFFIVCIFSSFNDHSTLTGLRKNLTSLVIITGFYMIQVYSFKFFKFTQSSIQFMQKVFFIAGFGQSNSNAQLKVIHF